MNSAEEAATLAAEPAIDFLAELRHELRTPLNAIIGYSEFILDDATPQLQSAIGDDLRIVISVARQLVASIDTQLRSQLIETGATSLAELRHTMRTVLDQLVGAVGLIEEQIADIQADAAVLEDIERIAGATKRLAELIDQGLTSTNVAVGRVAPPPAEPAGSAAPVVAREAAPGRILVADDNPANRDLLIRRLQQQGHQAVGVASGRGALDLLRKQPFDVLLLDIMMPEMSGFDVLRELNAEGRLHHLPVIMISALDDIESVVRCLELGAVDHLPKPFNPVILNARIGACLAIKRMRDKAEAYLQQIETELKTARDLQQMMVPSNFDAPHYPKSVAIHGALVPARRIGGDLYDFFYADDGRLYFLIADVCGKGIPAALYMTQTKTLFRVMVGQLVREGRAEAGALLAAINGQLAHENHALMFVTALTGILEPSSGALELSNGGHPMPIIVDDSGASFFDVPRGIPLGLAATHVYQTRRVELAPGAGLVLYTDGVTDMLNEAGVHFDDTRLIDAVARSADAKPDELVRSLRFAVAEHAEGTVQFDDVTIFALRYLGK